MLNIPVDFYDLVGAEIKAALAPMRTPDPNMPGRLICRCPAHENPHSVAADPKTAQETLVQGQCEEAVYEDAENAVLESDYAPDNGVRQIDFIAV